MSSFLVIIFQSGRIFEISENIWDSGLLFVEKYLLLKKLHIFYQIVQLNNTCAVGGLKKQKLKLACVFSSVPMHCLLLMVGGGGIMVDI